MWSVIWNIDPNCLHGCSILQIMTLVKNFGVPSSMSSSGILHVFFFFTFSFFFYPFLIYSFLSFYISCFFPFDFFPSSSFPLSISSCFLFFLLIPLFPAFVKFSSVTLFSLTFPPLHPSPLPSPVNTCEVLQMVDFLIVNHMSRLVHDITKSYRFRSF